MKNKRRNGAQPEMESPFRGYGGFPHQATRHPVLDAAFAFFDGKRHCLLKLWYLSSR